MLREDELPYANSTNRKSSLREQRRCRRHADRHFRSRGSRTAAARGLERHAGRQGAGRPPRAVRIQLSGSAASVDRRRADRPLRRRNARSRVCRSSALRQINQKLSLVPAGHRFNGWQKPRGFSRVNYFYIDPQAPLLADVELKPMLHFFDRDLWDTTMKLSALVENPSAESRRYAEALSVVLLHELLRVNNGGAAAEPIIHGGLAAWQQKRVADYIEEHLADDVPLATLGRAGQLEPLSFLAGVPAIVRHTAAPLPHQPAHRARQGPAGERVPVDDGDRHAAGLQRKQRLHGDIPAIYRTHPVGFPPQPAIASRSFRALCGEIVLYPGARTL